MEQVDIKGFEDYQITDDGRIWSKKTNKWLKPWLNNAGYLKIELNKKRFFVHRLVAEAFLTNEENKPCIDHKNTIKTDNRIENLRWCTHLENMKNPNTTEKMKGKAISEEHKIKLSNSHKGLVSPKRKPICQYSIDGTLIRIWNSKLELEKNGYYNVTKCCRGKRETAYGCIWKYKK